MNAATSPRPVPFNALQRNKFRDLSFPDFLEGEEGKYRSLLRSRSDNNSSSSVANLLPWHARVAVQELFFHALKLQSQSPAKKPEICVRLLSGSANNFVYGGGTLDVIKSFLSAGGIFHCLITSPNYTIAKCELAQCEKDFGSFKLRRAVGSPLVLAIPHFLVVDDSAYRIEAAPHPEHVSTDIDFNTISPETPATISFQGKEFGQQLVSLFDTIWGNPHLCQEIPATGKK